MDKYDRAIEYLTKYPGAQFEAWIDPYRHPAGSLFQHAGTKSGDRPIKSEKGGPCGCLTTIRMEFDIAYNQEITEAIRADERIPKRAKDIQIKDLPVFAEWQRKLDKIIPGRV